MTPIQCNVHIVSYIESRTLGGIGGKLPHKDPLELSGEYTFVYSYPLRTEASFTHALEPGMSPRDILAIAAKDYSQIYAEEANTQPAPPSPSAFLLNRGATQGKYGIWGHDLSDLFFEAIVIDTVKRTVSFAIGS